VTPKPPRERLLDHLNGIAGYNDKGFLWSRHTPDEVRSNQRLAQAVIDRLVEEIGEAVFSAGLLEKLKNGSAATDVTGAVEAQARAELLGVHHGRR
jgi:hypothetical protein